MTNSVAWDVSTMSSSLLISTGVVIRARFFPLAFETLDGDRKDKSSSETCSAFTMAEAAVFLARGKQGREKPKDKEKYKHTCQNSVTESRACLQFWPGRFFVDSQHLSSQQYFEA